MVAIHIKNSKKLTYSQLQEGQSAARSQSFTAKETENALRNHLDGASTKERRAEYEKFYRNK